MAGTPQSMIYTLSVTTAAALAQATAQLANGTITQDQWADIVAFILLGAHTSAAVIGRNAAGDTAPINPSDHRFAQENWAVDQPYLANFVQDIKDGKYDVPAPSEGTAVEKPAEPAAPTPEGEPSTLDTEKIDKRTTMYTAPLTGTANEAFVFALNPDTLINWRLGSDEHHCSQCPDLAANGPYKPDTLPTYPGKCDTDCLFNCQCYLEIDGAPDGFRPDFEAIKNARYKDYTGDAKPLPRTWGLKPVPQDSL